ncbi:cache domain-containing sensor histidine kinase [Cohnella thailandensis]|uniref:histidine kinase n=1 Tax=Cohnella thailandensis TaxID=557557 RepID=A0A841SXA1_9BACL|nr:sensor histidine kinase [Cohnella thailandensis]MBB6635902.1 histidine kinase [Cohnella thailandensis]MBP1976280.1 sensor histidine kinase YesM [Cohnella thailandensis]
MKRAGRLRMNSLRAQLILFFMIISLVVLSAASYIIYTFMLNQIKGQNERLMYQQFQQADHNIHGLVADVDRLSKLFLLDDQIQEILLHLSDKSELEFLAYKNLLHAQIEKFISNYGYVHSVYLTTENLGAMGGSGDTTLVQSQEEWNKSFFGSDVFRRSVEAFPEMIIQGGLRKSYFNPYMTGTKDGSVVSMIRGVRAIYDPKTSATLIFNVDERYLASLYSADLNPSDGDMYIVDSQGSILSGSRPERIGTTSAFHPSEAGQETYGSMDDRTGDASYQLVYYKLQDAGWYAVKEIPLRMYSGQILTVQRTLIAVFLCSILIIFAVSYFWLRKMIKPLHLLAGKMKDVSRGELGVTFDRIPNNELGIVVRRFNEMSLSIVDLLDKNNRMQESKRELEIEALQSQINPHFLYNTLNMIRWMATMIKADNIVGTIVALGNILRPVFSSKDPMCSLRDELSYLEHYIKIINMRFNNSIRFEIEVEEPELECRVPRFLLQPLVENSIAAGQREEEPVIFIGIHAKIEEGELRIRVSDSGIGLEPELLEELNRKLESGESHESSGGGTGIGLSNVNKRIRLYFGPEYGIHFEPREKGAEVVVRLPAGEA